jgi:N-acetylneuraminic acid mutarotase
MMFDALLHKLRGELRASCDAALASARTQLEDGLADLALERAKGLAEVNEERAKGLTDVAKEKADLRREIAAMQKQQEAQQGRVVLDIGGYRYPTSVQTLRRLPGTFFDAYFSGRYTMDQSEDGSIFIDRDGKHFGQVLEYLRDGVISVAEKDASELDVGELQWLKREFGFYCIELDAELQEVAFVVGGGRDGNICLSSVERYDVASGAWRKAAPMVMTRSEFGLCTLSDGDLYATGGANSDDVALASVERYDANLDTWSASLCLPRPRFTHCACAVGIEIYVLGGIEQDEEGGEETVSSVLKFDRRMQTWSEVVPMPEERADAGACVLGSEIYIFGGKTEDDAPTSTAYRFNTEINEWVTLAPMPEANSQHSVSVLDGLIYVMGGLASNDKDSISSVHRFDPVANLWCAMAPMSIARMGFGSFVLGGCIYAVGGFDGAGEDRLYTMERYSVALDRWSEVLGGELGATRDCFGALVVRMEVDLFESLIAKAKIEGL